LAPNVATPPATEYRASRTSLATSLMRAVHTRLDPYPLIHDPWGDRLVPSAFRVAYRAAMLARVGPEERERMPATIGGSYWRSRQNRV
jgi:O-methyltransferase involved in polyketide biosynthesis